MKTLHQNEGVSECLVRCNYSVDRSCFFKPIKPWNSLDLEQRPHPGHIGLSRLLTQTNYQRFRSPGPWRLIELLRYLFNSYG
jgi:hypothetical protein